MTDDRAIESASSPAFVSSSPIDLRWLNRAGA